MSDSCLYLWNLSLSDNQENKKHKTKHIFHTIYKTKHEIRSERLCFVKTIFRGIKMLFHKNELKEFNKKFNEPYGEISNTGKYNTILSKNYCLGMNSQKTSRNNNVLVLGRVNPDHEKNFVEPNLLQANRSYVVIDSDELYEKYKDFFNKEGYTIKVFNLIDMEHSNYYNPFRYI